MPRQAASGLSFSSFAGTPERLKPPPELGPAERRLFAAIVAGVKPDHFQVQDGPLLARYVEASIMAGQAADHIRVEGAVAIDAQGRQRPSPWVQIHGQCTKAMLGLSTRLRLSPQARAGNVPGRPPSVMT
jgi:phage terminase small subunit